MPSWMWSSFIPANKIQKRNTRCGDYLGIVGNKDPSSDYVSCMLEASFLFYSESPSSYEGPRAKSSSCGLALTKG